MDPLRDPLRREYLGVSTGIVRFRGGWREDQGVAERGRQTPRWQVGCRPLLCTSPRVSCHNSFFLLLAVKFRVASPSFMRHMPNLFVLSAVAGTSAGMLEIDR